MSVRAVQNILAAGLCGVLASCGSGTPTTPANKGTITLASTSASFGAQVGGGSPAADTVGITSSGTGTVSGLAVGTVTYTGAGTGWLTGAVTTTTAPAKLLLTATTGSLAAGTYTATVPVTASGATNSPQTVTARFTVNPPAGTTNLTAPGQSVTFLTSPNFATNLTLQAGGHYLIAVVNTDTSAAVNEDFSLVGTSTSPSVVVHPAPVLAARAHAPKTNLASRLVVAPARVPEFTAGPLLARLSALRRLQTNHVRMLDRNAEIFRRQRGRLAPASALSASRPRFAISQTIGTVNKVYVAKAFGATCAEVDSIGARTVAVGTHVIVLADTNKKAWPDSLRPDSAFYQTFANEYDATTFPHVTNFIGDPLAYDPHLSGIRKVTVTISPVLNNFGGGIVAFVDGCDFLPVQPTGPNAVLGNFTEMFYYWVAGTNGFTTRDWENLMRATAAHETKHIVSYTDRIINNSPVFEQVWLEEGLAQESSEIWERKFSQAAWKGHANFAQTVECEINLFTSGGCDPGSAKPIALVGSHLPFLFSYLQAESGSPAGLGLGNTGSLATEARYGAGWEFARWATDQYASGGEQPFIKSLVNDPLLNGLANLSSHTGASVQELLVYWNLATAIYDTATYIAADPRITIPSFNLGDIFFAGQTKLQCGSPPTKCGLFTNSGSPVFPIAPAAYNAGPFTATVAGVPGTTAVYFMLSAPASGAQYLQLLGGSGTALASSSGFRVGIIRVQ